MKNLLCLTMTIMLIGCSTTDTRPTVVNDEIHINDGVYFMVEQNGSYILIPYGEF